MTNEMHLGPMAWYEEQGFKGSPQSLTVDDYEAIRDGRTVYVNAANINNETNSFYTNIYIISYSQDAEKATENIFTQILKNWHFNANLDNNGLCRINSGIVCARDQDCPDGDYCQSEKARVIRDTRRLSDLEMVKAALESYRAANQSYPALAAGSYLPGRTVSVWPSWQKVLAQELKTPLPEDPQNAVGICAENFNPATCWDESAKSFAGDPPGDLPPGSRIYAYAARDHGQAYDLCTQLETGTAYANIIETICSIDALPNNPPSISCTPMSASIYGLYSQYVRASDQDGDSFSWTISRIGDWSSWLEMPVIRNTVLTNEMTYYSARSGSAGTYRFNATVTDTRGLSATRECEVTLLNSAPIVSSACAGNLRVGNEYECGISSSDQDGHAIASVSVAGLPAGINYDNLAHKITGSANTAGSYVITISATDQYGLTSLPRTFTLNVNTYCGDGIIENPNRERVVEYCDGNAQNCTDSEGYNGTRACNQRCRFEQCIVTESCGDAIVNGYHEQCDGNSQPCTTAGGYDGSQTCNSSCRFNSCISAERCGDGLENGLYETCDRGDGVNTNTPCVPPSGGTCAYCDLQCREHTVSSPPVVTALSLSLGSVIISYTVSTPGSVVSRVEIWRADYVSGQCDDSVKTGCHWSEVSALRQNLLGQNNSAHTGTATDNPPAGTYWYGLHVVSRENRCTNEENKDCTTKTPNGQPPVGPQKIVVASAPACSGPVPGCTDEDGDSCPGTDEGTRIILESSLDPADFTSMHAAHNGFFNLAKMKPDDLYARYDYSAQETVRDIAITTDLYYYNTQFRDFPESGFYTYNTPRYNRFFIPPGITGLDINYYMAETAPARVLVARYLQPVGVWSNFITGAEISSDDFPFVGEGEGLEGLDRDVFMHQYGGHLTLVSVYFTNPVTRNPQPNKEGGWFYLKYLATDGIPYNYNLIRISYHFETLDSLQIYRDWYNSVAWDTNGDPLPLIGTNLGVCDLNNPDYDCQDNNSAIYPGTQTAADCGGFSPQGCTPNCATGPGCRASLANAADIGAECCDSGLRCYQCDANYSWNAATGSCQPNTQTAGCSAKSANSDWNTVSSITQTWNGSTWSPANNSVYNTTPSSGECRYKCSSGYTWNSNACIMDCPAVTLNVIPNATIYANTPEGQTPYLTPITYSYNPSIIDSQTVTYSISGHPSWLVINPSTGRLQGTAPAGANQTYNITLTASNSCGSANSKSFTLTARPNTWCGDGIIQTANLEICDTNNFGGVTCDDYSHSVGPLHCIFDCRTVGSPGTELEFAL